MNYQIGLLVLFINIAYGLPMFGLRILIPYNKSSYHVGANNTHSDVLIRVGPLQAFRIVKGLDSAPNTVSFRLLSNEKFYIRCRQMVIYLEANDGSLQFKQDASFYVRQNKYFNWYSAIESAVSPGLYIRHQNEKLILRGDDGTKEFTKAASFLLAPYEPRIGKHWQMVSGELKIVTTGQSGVWGITSTSRVVVRDGTYNYGTITYKTSPGFAWSIVHGVLLRDIASGYNIVWGTGLSNEVYVRRGINSTNPTGSHWERVIGVHKRITVNPRTNEVWSLSSMGFIFRREGVPRIEKDGDAAGKRWRWISGRLKFVSAGDVGVWGLDFAGQVMYRTGTRTGYGPGEKWTVVDNQILKQLHAGNDIVWGVGTDNNIYVRLGINEAAPTGTQWLRVNGKLKYVAVNNIDGSVWGLGPLNHHSLIFFREGSRLVNSGYAPWTNFGECNSKFGYRTKLRYCIEEAPGYGKDDCIGATTDFLKCNVDVCVKA